MLGVTDVTVICCGRCCGLSLALMILSCQYTCPRHCHQPDNDIQKVSATEKKIHKLKMFDVVAVIVIIMMVAIVTAVNFAVPVVIKCLTTMH